MSGLREPGEGWCLYWAMGYLVAQCGRVIPAEVLVFRLIAGRAA
jgi:hypothetical protein